MRKILFFCLIFFAQLAFAAPSPPTIGCEPSDFWKEYKAERPGCGDVLIWRRECRWVCENCITTDGEEVCASWKKECPQNKVKRAAICNPWQKPKRDGNVTQWREKKIKCKADPECFGQIAVKEFRDGRGKVTSTEIHLPTKFYFEIPTPDKTGWGLSCGPNSLLVQTKDFSRILNIKEAFSTESTFYATSDRAILDELWAGNDFEELANFLIQFTGDSSLKANSGEMKIKANVAKSQDTQINVEYSSNTKITLHRPYEKLKRAKEEKEIKKQIEYFIHFLEELDIKRYFQRAPHPLTGETIDTTYCGHLGGRHPKLTKAETLLVSKNIYSPSQDRKVGPCTIEEGKENFVRLKFCLDTKCGPDQVPEVPFATVNAPEPIGILAFKRDKIDWLVAINPLTGLKKNVFWGAKITRWIDTDWNGDGWPEIPKEEADFIDFQFCGQDQIDLFKSPFSFRALYRGKKLIFDPGKGCPKDPELAELEERAPESCVDVNEPCICDEKPQWCEIECGKVAWIDLDICHPVQNPESLRIPVGEIPNIEEFIRKNRSDEEPRDCTSSYPFLSVYGLFLAETEEISLDWPDDPYYGVLDITYPIDLWKWDLHGLMQYFPASPILNIWQVQKTDEKYWSQKWHFKLTTKVPLKQKEQPIWLGLLKAEIVPMEVKDFQETIAFLPEYLPVFNENGEIVFNRLQHLEFKPTPRTLSFKIKICCPLAGGECLKFPPIFTHLRYRKLPGILQSQLKNFTFWEVWPCLKYPGCRKGESINKFRLDRPYTFHISPCVDEWGKVCIWDVKLNIRSTGAVPKNLSPPPPDLTKVPRFLKVDPVAGAVSYILEINHKELFYGKTVGECEDNKCKDPETGEEKECEKGYCPEKEMFWMKMDLKEENKYKWRIRSCADFCSLIDKKEYLHCGEYSEPVEFLGCKFSPPSLPSSPEIAKTFLPGSVLLSWEKVSCYESPIFYQLKVAYAKSAREKREGCQKMHNKDIIDTILQTPQFTLSNLSCYGTYYWQIRACLDPDCEKETGRWSPVWYFNIAPELPPGGAGGGFWGLGTCKKLAPDCGLKGCTIKDIPKLIFNILNCLLWTGFPVLIILGIAATGFVLILFATRAELLERIREMWRGILIGGVIMFFAWTLLNIIFLILGWRKEIFGDWWNPL